MLSNKKHDELVDRFSFRAVTTEQMEAIKEIRNAMTALAVLISEKAPESRYQSLAITTLEEANMWASKAVSHGAL